MPALCAVWSAQIVGLRCPSFECSLFFLYNLNSTYLKCFLGEQTWTCSLDQGGFIDRPNRLNCREEWIDDIIQDVSLKTWNIFIRRRLDIKFLNFTKMFRYSPNLFSSFITRTVFNSFPWSTIFLGKQFSEQKEQRS